MTLHESGQMYLEAIYVLLQQNTNIRAIDVGAYLGYSKPSVSRAVGILKNAEYITVDEDGFTAEDVPLSYHYMGYVREVLARNKAVLDIITGKKPYFEY